MKTCLQCKGTGKVQCSYTRTLKNGWRVEHSEPRQLIAVCGVCMGKGSTSVDGGP